MKCIGPLVFLMVLVIDKHRIVDCPENPKTVDYDELYFDIKRPLIFCALLVNDVGRYDSKNSNDRG